MSRRRQTQEIKLRSRNKKSLKIRKNIFISCEGKTEEVYFESLKKEFHDVAVIKIKHDTRTSAGDVVQNFEKLFKNECIDKNDLKLCVFDCDRNTDEQLNIANMKAINENKKILFSNPCFEIWLYWHFDKKLRRITASTLKNFLSNDCHLGEYWNDKNIYSKIKNETEKAISKAKKKKEELDRLGLEPISTQSMPYSNIYDLIEYLKDL